MSGYLLETFVDISKFSKKANASTAVVYDGKIHILGGRDRAQGLLHYSWDGTEWTQESELPYKVTSDSCAVVYDNKIHILGGSLAPANISHYSWDGTSWVSESTLPYTFSKGGAVVYDNKIHILGGGNTTAAKKYHRTYDGTNWSENISTLPFGFSNNVNPIVHDDKIYIFNRPRYYSWNGASWTEEGRINKSFTYMSKALSYDGTIHLIGAGGTNNGTMHLYLSSTGWVYDSAKLPYYGMNPASGCVVYDNKINVLGNRSGNNGHHYYLIDGPDYPVKSIKRAFINAYYDREYNEYILTEDYEWSTDPWKDYYEKVYNVETREWEYIKVSYDPEEPISPRDNGLYEKYVVLKRDNRKVKKAWICDENNVKKVILEAIPDETIIDKNTPPFFGDDDPVWYMSNNLLTKTNDEIIHLLVPYNNDKHILDSRGYPVIPLWVRNYAYDGNEWTRLEDFGRADMEAGDYAWPDWVVARGKEIYLYFRTLNSYNKRIRYIKEDGTTGTMGNGLSFDGKILHDIISDDTGDRAYEISYTTASNPTYPFSVCTILDHKIKVVGRMSKNIIGSAPYAFKCGCAVTRPWSRYIIIFGTSSSTYAPSGVL